MGRSVRPDRWPDVRGRCLATGRRSPHASLAWHQSARYQLCKEKGGAVATSKAGRICDAGVRLHCERDRADPDSVPVLDSGPRAWAYLQPLTSCRVESSAASRRLSVGSKTPVKSRRNQLRQTAANCRHHGTRDVHRLGVTNDGLGKPTIFCIRHQYHPAPLEILVGPQRDRGNRSSRRTPDAVIP